MKLSRKELEEVSGLLEVIGMSVDGLVEWMGGGWGRWRRGWDGEGEGGGGRANRGTEVARGFTLI